jgi:hypothetical protein
VSALVHKTLTLAGSAGSATGSASTQVLMQRLVGVEVLRAGQPSTLDLTVTNGGRTLLTLTNVAADRLVALKLPVQDATGADVAGQLDHPLVNGNVTVTAAQGDAGDVTVRLFLA